MRIAEIERGVNIGKFSVNWVFGIPAMYYKNPLEVLTHRFQTRCEIVHTPGEPEFSPNIGPVEENCLRRDAHCLGDFF